jgi:hypothetical protein
MRGAGLSFAGDLFFAVKRHLEVGTQTGRKVDSGGILLPLYRTIGFATRNGVRYILALVLSIVFVGAAVAQPAPPPTSNRSGSRPTLHSRR